MDKVVEDVNKVASVARAPSAVRLIHFTGGTGLDEKEIEEAFPDLRPDREKLLFIVTGFMWGEYGPDVLLSGYWETRETQ